MAEHSEESLQQRFIACEQTMDALENGTMSTKDIQEPLKATIAELQSMTMTVNALALFSSNENIEELPNGSLHCMLIPCYLGIAHQNLMNCNPEAKSEELRMAKVYYRDFLRRLREYGVAELGEFPWEKDEGEEEERKKVDASVKSPAVVMAEAETKRKEKIDRFRNQKEQHDRFLELTRQRAINPEDDSAQRDLLLAQLRYYAYRALSELESIEAELPMLEMMAARARAGITEPIKPERGPSRKPFIITRDKAQKAVYGLGYPSIPVMSVDEWYDQKMASGAWGEGGPGGSGTSKEPDSRLSDSENEDDGRDDERREAKLRWDEYKDTHRRGWGNTHNKG
ncbi:ppfr-4 [Pristionchus pacificus]|nr:ppfr-4 [Pristionchus pacificus]